MKADLVLKSKAIFNGRDKKVFSGAVAIRGNQILCAGEAAEELIGADTRVIDCGDKLVMPAFVDAHTHYFSGAISSSDHMCTEISQSQSEEECAEMIRQYALAHPDEKRIRGMGWFPANWQDAPLPTKASLDAAVPDRPVYLLAADAHTCWLNSKALAEAGITPDMKPKSGSVGVDEEGRMTGLLFEPEAYKPAMDKIMDIEPEIMKEINRDFIAGLNACGITSASEMMGDDYDAATYKKYDSIMRLEEDDELTLRLHIFGRMDGYTDFTKALDMQKRYASEKLRFSGVKGFIDGVTSTFTGLLLEPYADKPETCGIGVPLASWEDNKRYVTAANSYGLPVRLHCIADGSVRMALDLFQASIEKNGRHGLRNTVEHIETIHPDDIPRFAQLDVIPSMQPYHLTLDFNEKIRRVGEERCRWEWPHKTILNHGGQLAFGTDYPVVEYNPFPNIYSAVTRCDDDGNPTGVNPQECIGLDDTLIAYTSGAARAYSRDDIGVLEEGKLADVIVVDRNLFAIDPMEIKDAAVEMTIMDGKIVFER
ncbi:MAG: amidohydrolase [Clostridiales Family XIII bacterium]|uniref:amidohydrolase n=1 Tax=Hominibacterium faecale TaxID=2839743 RepID=UPI0022B2943E|nr:amidohydrolase [Hominibacterium faecale]MCI7304325.1 amidohydrolase [Clostridia bacterium]MDE8731659.1 amidohydrolase [Eubacteriales bacterium DFI.9.88]MDY3010931.1 amidohydrolase [Clostridiales Family XIII bacterium]